MFYVYFLKSLKNGKVYVGSTARDPKIRCQEHNRGLNKFTSENIPFCLVYYEEYLCISDARKRELFYKTGLGRKVRDLIFKSMKI